MAGIIEPYALFRQAGICRTQEVSEKRFPRRRSGKIQGSSLFGLTFSRFFDQPSNHAGIVCVDKRRRVKFWFGRSPNSGVYACRSPSRSRFSPGMNWKIARH